MPPMTSIASLLAPERLLSPLDRLRRRWFAVVARRPGLARIAARREGRMVALAGLHGVVAFVGAVLFPIPLLLLGPLVLGVAHVAADVRHLVLRRLLSAGWRCAVLGACAVLFGLRALVEVSGIRWPVDRIELAMAAIAVGAAALLGVRAGDAYTNGHDRARARTRGRAATAAVVAAVLGTAAQHRPDLARIVFVHAHNFVAIGALLLFLRAPARALVVPALAWLGGAVLLSSGLLVGLSLAAPGAQAFQLSLTEASQWMAPGLPPRAAIGVTTGYVFLQSVHYAIWLLLVPQADRSGQGMSTFQMSARSFRADFGVAGVVLVALAAVAVVGAACAGLQRARAVYLSLAMFHGYLELAMVAYFWWVAPPPAHCAQECGAHQRRDGQHCRWRHERPRLAGGIPCHRSHRARRRGAVPSAPRVPRPPRGMCCSRSAGHPPSGLVRLASHRSAALAVPIAGRNVGRRRRNRRLPPRLPVARRVARTRGLGARQWRLLCGCTGAQPFHRALTSKSQSWARGH